MAVLWSISFFLTLWGNLLSTSGFNVYQGGIVYKTNTKRLNAYEFPSRNMAGVTRKRRLGYFRNFDSVVSGTTLSQSVNYEYCCILNYIFKLIKKSRRVVYGNKRALRKQIRNLPNDLVYFDVGPTKWIDCVCWVCMQTM